MALEETQFATRYMENIYQYEKLKLRRGEFISHVVESNGRIPVKRSDNQASQGSEMITVRQQLLITNFGSVMTTSDVSSLAGVSVVEPEVKIHRYNDICLLTKDDILMIKQISKMDDIEDNFNKIVVLIIDSLFKRDASESSNNVERFIEQSVRDRHGQMTDKLESLRQREIDLAEKEKNIKVLIHRFSKLEHDSANKRATILSDMAT